MDAVIISKDIRKLAGNRLKHYTVTQGSCAGPKYVYMIFEQKPKHGRPHRCKVVKYDPSAKRIVKVSGALKVGHGNDITLKGHTLYITHSAGAKTIHRVDSKTLKQRKGVKVRVPKRFKGVKAFNGIASYGSGFLLRVMGGNKVAVANSKFEIVNVFRTETNWTTSQGMTIQGRLLLRAYSHAQSGKNYLVWYSLKGKQKRRSKVELEGEMESVFLFNDEIYVTAYIKRGKKREAYIAKIDGPEGSC